MDITHLKARVMQAEALGPVVKAFAEEIGEEKTKEILTKVHTEAAAQYGREVAREVGSATIGDLVRLGREWGAGNALEEEVLEETDKTYLFNVTRCRFAEEYHKLGLQDWGMALSCCRDVGFIQGFNPKIRMERTMTVMEGHPVCDFRYFLED